VAKAYGEAPAAQQAALPWGLLRQAAELRLGASARAWLRDHADGATHSDSALMAALAALDGISVTPHRR
jgi:hypothetical protein